MKDAPGNVVEQEGGSVVSRPHNHLHAVEPSYMQEFKEISSHYELDDKVDSDDISSCGEFNQAEKMDVYKEDDTEVFIIEHAQDW